MTEKLDAACLQVAAVVRAISGIRQTPDYVMDNANVFPVAVVYPNDGNKTNYAIGSERNLCNIYIDLLIPAQQGSLDRQFQTLIPLVDLVTNALLAQMADSGGRFGNTIDTFDQVAWAFLPNAAYAADPMRGYRFILRNVKILQ